MTAKLVDPVDRCGVLYKPVNPTTMLVHVQCIPAQPLQLLRHLCDDGDDDKVSSTGAC